MCACARLRTRQKENQTKTSNHKAREQVTQDYAAKECNAAVVRLLLDTGKVNIHEKELVKGMTALELAKDGHDQLWYDWKYNEDLTEKGEVVSKWSLLGAQDRGHEAVINVLEEYMKQGM